MNFLQKNQWAHMSISPGSGASGLQGLPCLKHFNVLQWESRFALQLNAAKTTEYIKKTSNKNYSELNFQQKTQWALISIVTRSGCVRFFNSKRKIKKMFIINNFSFWIILIA